MLEMKKCGLKKYYWDILCETVPLPTLSFDPKTSGKTHLGYKNIKIFGKFQCGGHKMETRRGRSHRKIKKSGKKVIIMISFFTSSYCFTSKNILKTFPNF